MLRCAQHDTQKEFSMLLIQAIIILFAIFALVRALSRYRQGRLPRGWLAFWIIFWFAVVFVAVSPSVTDRAAHFVGVGRGADFAIYLSVVALFYLAFRLFVKIEDVERDVT